MNKTRKTYDEIVMDHIEECNECNYYSLLKWAATRSDSLLKHVEKHVTHYAALLDGYRELNGLEPAYSDYIDD